MDSIMDKSHLHACRSTADGIPSTGGVTLESSVEQAKRAFALKKYEDAIDHYATALELV